MAFKLKFRTLFPASVTASSPLTLIKTGFRYTFGIDLDALQTSFDVIYTPFDETHFDTVMPVSANGYNIFAGPSAGNTTLSPSGGAVTLASENFGMGHNTLKALTTGYQNVGIGNDVMPAVTTGYQNTAYGWGALTSLTTGTNNVAVGYAAMGFGTTAANNTAAGNSALFKITTGSHNTGIGSGAGYNTTTGSNSTHVGRDAGYSNTTGTWNVCVGVDANPGNSTGSGNTVVGGESFYGFDLPDAVNNQNLTGSNNTIIGYHAGSTGGPGGNTQNRQGSTALGYLALITADNQMVLGGTNVTATVMRGAVTGPTTLSASTSATTPLVIGGAAASSTLTLESTSGAGTTDSILFKTGSQVTRGTLDTNGKWAFGANAVAASNAPLVDINSSAAATLPPTSGVVMRVLAANGATSSVTFQNYGGQGAVQSFVAGGTASVPTAAASLTNALNIQGLFWDGAEWGSGGNLTPSVDIRMQTSQLQAVGAHGTQILFDVTTNGTATRITGMTLQNSGGLSIGTTTDPGVGALLTNTSVKSQGATAGIGYATGAGGTVTQGTNRNTGVTLDKISGNIVLFSAVNAAVSGATANTFTVTNAAVAAGDVVIVVQKSGTDKYLIYVTAVAAGSFQIQFFAPAGGTTNEAPVFNFAVIKAVAA